MLLKNLFLLSKWNLTWRRTRNEEGVAFINNNQVFTLFKRIFVPDALKDESDLENVILHERAHIRQLHFIDLMLMEFTLLLTWFNPFSWLISRMIKENHEHLADREVLSTGINPARYRAQLMNHTLGVNVFRLGTQFNHSLTLKRFKMMKKPKKSPSGMLKIALLIPAVLVTLGLTTGMTPQQKTLEGKVVFADTGEPATGASVVVRHGTLGCVVDTDGSFRLNVDGNPELVISFVGYESLVVKASEVGKKPLKMKVKTYEMDLESVPLEVKKNTSGSISLRLKNGSKANPVFIVDGKKVEGGVENLDPDNIASISVIKDSEDPLVKKYNATDGLILITSKEGVASQKKEKMLHTPKESLEMGKETVGNESDDPVFYVVEDMPKFPGGLSALKTYVYSHLEYPENAKNQGIEGEVIVRFLINEKGEAVQEEVLRSSYKGFDAPALKVIKEMPDWAPENKGGKP
jgi:TonB family protein